MADGLPVIDGLALPAFAGLRDPVAEGLGRAGASSAGARDRACAEQVETLARIERRLLPLARRVIVTSPQTATRPRRVPGARRRGSASCCRAPIRRRSRAARAGRARTPLRRLADAAQGAPGPAGSAGRAPGSGMAPHLRRQPRSRSAGRAGGRARRSRAWASTIGCSLVGEQDEAGLAPLYDRADLFVLASYHEGYGMVLAEALARGLPIVATKAGAIPGTVPPSAGMLVEPGDPAALAGALRQIMTEPALRDLLCAGAASERERLPGWADAVRAFSAELERGRRLSRFAHDWLALREPYDRAARSRALADRFADGAGAGAPGDRSRLRHRRQSALSGAATGAGAALAVPGSRPRPAGSAEAAHARWRRRGLAGRGALRPRSRDRPAIRWCSTARASRHPPCSI